MTTEAPNPSPVGDDILAAIGAEPDPQRRERVKRVLDEHRARRDVGAEAAVRERLGRPPASRQAAA